MVWYVLCSCLNVLAVALRQTHAVLSTDRRYCVICKCQPTRLCHPKFPESSEAMSEIFDTSISTSISVEQRQSSVVIEFNNTSLTLSVPDLPVDAPSNDPSTSLPVDGTDLVVSSVSPSAVSSTALTSQSSMLSSRSPPVVISGNGPTLKCKNCFARGT